MSNAHSHEQVGDASSSNWKVKRGGINEEKRMKTNNMQKLKLKYEEQTAAAKLSASTSTTEQLASEMMLTVLSTGHVGSHGTKVAPALKAAS